MTKLSVSGSTYTAVTPTRVRVLGLTTTGAPPSASTPARMRVDLLTVIASPYATGAPGRLRVAQLVVGPAVAASTASAYMRVTSLGLIGSPATYWLFKHELEAIRPVRLGRVNGASVDWLSPPLP